MCGVFGATVGARSDLNTPSHHCWHQTRKVMQPFDIVGIGREFIPASDGIGDGIEDGIGDGCFDMQPL